MPITVGHEPRPIRIEHLERLGAIGFSIRLNLLAGELRPGRRSPARIADHRREIPDDQDRFVAEVLELAKLSQDDRVAEMEIGTGGVDAEFDSKRTSQGEFLAELRFADDLGSALFENG